MSMVSDIFVIVFMGFFTGGGNYCYIWAGSVSILHGRRKARDSLCEEVVDLDACNSLETRNILMFLLDFLRQMPYRSNTAY